MIYLILFLAALAAAVLVYRLRQSGNSRRDDAAAAPPALPSPPTGSPQAERPIERAVPAAPAVPADHSSQVATAGAAASGRAHRPQTGLVRTADSHIKAMLDGFEWASSADLSEREAAEIVDVLARIPRPPSALHKLVSPDFLAQSNTLDLGEMVMAEPQIAAKVLAMVNSPAYGLKSPLGSVGQAVTFLGMNTVRSVCLKFMLDASFQSKDPEVRMIYERLWNASSFASELCSKLAQSLQMPDSGALVTHVVLSFLGHVASHSLLDKELLLPMVKKGMLERARVEQRELGLCSAELGSLLMRQWGMPAPIVDSVRAIDLTLVTPFDAAATERLGSALCYVCARLGERLAYGEVQDLSQVKLLNDRSLEFFQLQSYLVQSPLARLDDLLQAPELVSAINKMALVMQVRS